MNSELSAFSRNVGQDRTTLWRDLALIIGATLAIRLAWALIAPINDPFLRQSPLLGDAAAYDRIARSVLAGTGFTTHPPELSAFWPPLYPAWLALVYSVTGYNLTAARIAQAFVGVAVPVSFFFIALKPFGRRVAWLAALGLMLYPLLTYFNAWLIAEGLFMALLSVGMLILSTIPESPRLPRIGATGLVFGLAALAKPFMLFVLPFLALWLLLALPSSTVRRRSLAVLVLAIATLVIILPWTMRNYGVYGQPVLISTNGGYTFLGANNPNAWGGHDEGFPLAIPGLNDAEMEDAYYEEAFQWIRNHPGDFARLLIPKYRRLFSPLSVASYREDYPIPGATAVYVAYAFFLLASLLGAVKALPYWRQAGFLYAPIAGVIISAGLFYGDARNTLPMVPSLVVFTALIVSSVVAAFPWARTSTLE